MCADNGSFVRSLVSSSTGGCKREGLGNSFFSHILAESSNSSKRGEFPGKPGCVEKKL